MRFLRHNLLLRTLILLVGPLSAFATSNEVDLIKESVSWLIPMIFSFNQSNPCYKDFTDVVWGLIRLETWALSMLDAVGRPEANLLGGYQGWVGDYTQCIGIKQGSVEGQHCWVKIQSNGFSFIGICLPKTCKNRDFDSIRGPFSIDCEYNHNEFTMTSYVAIAICCLLSLCIVFGTLTDVKRRRRLSSNLFKDKGGDEKQLVKGNRKCFGWEVFSLLSNGRSLFSVKKQTKGTFPELNALKTIAIVLVIFNHSYALFRYLYIIKNPIEYLNEKKEWYYQLLFQFYILSIFFLITGFLTFNSIIKKPPPTNQWRFLSSYVINRYLKLLVAPALILFIFRIALQPLSFSGPLHKIPETQCGRHWWMNALFITNWFAVWEQCFPSWWFLTSSVQLHLLSLLIVVPLINKRYRMCALNGCALVVWSWGYLAWKDILHPLYPEGNEMTSTYGPEVVLFYDTTYQNPLFYTGPYVLGMGLAWVLFKHKDGISLTKKQVCFGWMLTSLLLYLTLFGIYLRPNRMLRRMHNMFGTTMYGLFIAWIILLCHSTTNIGILGSCLRWKYCLPLSKLSLCAYLLNLSVIESYYFLETDKITYSFSSQWVYFLRHWIVTHFMAVIATLTMEMPLNAILDAILIYTKISLK